MTRRTRFLDGCHQYGWLIAPVISMIGTLTMFAYFMGGLNQKVESGFVSFNQRITRIESALDGFLR